MKTLLTILGASILYTAAWAQDTTTVKRHVSYDSTTIIHQNNTGAPVQTAPPVQTPPAPAPAQQPAVQPTPAPAPAPETNTSYEPPKSNGKFLIGARFMPTLTSLSFAKTSSGDVSTSLAVSYGFGALFGVNFNDNWGMQLEIMYSQMAQKYREGGVDRQVKLSYVNIPLLMNFNTGYSKPVNFNVCLGPQLGINTGSSVTTTNGSNNGDSLHAVIAVKPADIGLAYGLGLDFNLGPTSAAKLSIGYRGVFGLLDISNQSQTHTTNDYYVLDRSHVRTYAAYIGLTFAL